MNDLPIYFSEVLFLAEWWSGSDVRVFAEEDDFKKLGTEHALIIMNHTYEVDWLIGWIVADRSQTLGASFLPVLFPNFLT